MSNSKDNKSKRKRKMINQVVVNHQNRIMLRKTFEYSMIIQYNRSNILFITHR